MYLLETEAQNIYPNVAKAEDAVDPRLKGEAVVAYCEPLTTKEVQYPRLSRRVNNMAIFYFSGYVNKCTPDIHI